MNGLRSTIARWITVRVEDEELARRGRLLNIIALGMMAVLVLELPVVLFGEARLFGLLLVALQFAACVVTCGLSHSGRVRTGGYVLLGSLSLFIAAYSVLNDPGPESLSIPYWLCVVVITAAMALDPRAAFRFATLDTLLLLGVAGVLMKAAPEYDVVAVGRAVAFPVLLFYLMALLSWLLADSLNRSLQQARQSNSDMDAQLRRNQALMGELRDRLAPTAEELAATMEQMRTASEGIAATTSQTSQGAESQARQTETVSHSMAQLETATRQIADNSHDVGTASTQTQTWVQNTAQMLKTLKTKLGEIERVMTLVEKIADQTNLLSLNASIEAARAGEHGAGFAVVADEVRRLADHSANSVGEITGLSREIAERLREVLTAMEKAQEGATRAAALSQKIVAATEEQGKATEAVVGAMNEVASVAEENAASSEEIAASVEEQVASIGQVASSAQMLSELVANLQQTLEGQEREE